jgi:hypothetical protein
LRRARFGRGGRTGGRDLAWWRCGGKVKLGFMQQYAHSQNGIGGAHKSFRLTRTHLAYWLECARAIAYLSALHFAPGSKNYSFRGNLQTIHGSSCIGPKVRNSDSLSNIGSLSSIVCSSRQRPRDSRLLVIENLRLK